MCKTCSANKLTFGATRCESPAVIRFRRGGSFSAKRPWRYLCERHWLETKARQSPQDVLIVERLP